MCFIFFRFSFWSASPVIPAYCNNSQYCIVHVLLQYSLSYKMYHRRNDHSNDNDKFKCDPIASPTIFLILLGPLNHLFSDSSYQIASHFDTATNTVTLSDA